MANEILMLDKHAREDSFLQFKSQLSLFMQQCSLLFNRQAKQIYGKFDSETGIKMDETLLKKLCVLFCF